VKPIKAALKETVPTAKKEYGPGGTTKRSIGHKVKLYGPKGRRAKAGLNDVSRAFVIVGPRASFSKTVTKKFRFIPGAKGVRRFKSTRPQKIQPARVAHLIEKQSHYTARAVAKSRSAAIAAARNVLVAGWKRPARRGAARAA
jgi:hypothetical protein